MWGRQEQFRAGVKADRPSLHVWLAGEVPYCQAVAWQERLLAGWLPSSPDLLLLLEHPPVITLGRRADLANLLYSPSQLMARGIDLVATSRGGDVTYHGPGQLIGYPMVDLTRYGLDLHAYLRQLERVLILTLKDFGLQAEGRLGSTGVWLGLKKIASIGIAVRQWVTWHGFALNVSNSLDGFSMIVPCGLPGVQMTSLSEALGRIVTTAEVIPVLIDHFATVFNRTLLSTNEFTAA